jgi:hypothetical protein
MSYVFVLDSRDYKSGIQLNVDQYIHDYYKILKQLLYYSHKSEVKVVCDEYSIGLFEDLPASVFIMNRRKDIEESCHLDDVMINHREITDEKENLKFHLSVTYPFAWTKIVRNIRERFS